MSDEPITGPTHICVDGLEHPGKGKFANKNERCRKCYNKYLQDRRARQREERYAVGGVSQVGMSRGHDGSFSTTHGFYRKNLDADEQKLAEKLHKEIKATYEGLDDQVDDMTLYLGISNFVKALRKAPDRPNDHNIRDMQSFYERQFHEAMSALALSRRQRKEEGKKDNLREQLANLFHKKAVSGFTLDAPKTDPDLQPAP
jgi:hypothetical protein